MSRMRLTQQEADPIGAITAAPLVAIGAALAFVDVDRAHVRALAGGGIAVRRGARRSHWSRPRALVAAISAAPSRAPFTAERLWLVVALAVGAAIAEYVSHASAPTGTSTTTSARSSSAC